MARRQVTAITVISKISDREVSRAAALVVIHGDELGRKHDLIEHETLIGRSGKADIQVDQESVSRHHARLINEKGRSSVEDLGSTNGTIVNDQHTSRGTREFGNRASREALAHGPNKKPACAKFVLPILSLLETRPEDRCLLLVNRIRSSVRFSPPRRATGRVGKRGQNMGTVAFGFVAGVFLVATPSFAAVERRLGDSEVERWESQLPKESLRTESTGFVFGSLGFRCGLGFQGGEPIESAHLEPFYGLVAVDDGKLARKETGSLVDSKPSAISGALHP